ncbi:hypothetical protein BDY19DRAFT_1060844 [Irpex rosettiformis]|uniref:Uncharacterized protein n=1 Tax=Irpex rosettiformis TaxID=378272 RepID=A0ACB8TNN7_9APHY|nr:hypothetical protein BDY19DRAFT_1060844 [Irpex rosettiformis]
MVHSPENNVRAELVGTFVEILLYGIYLVVFCKCLQVLRIKYLEGRPTTVMTCTAITIFALVTIHFIMDVLRATNAFTTHTDIPNYAIAYYTVVRRDLDIIKSAAYIAMTIISDGLIGYRTFVVWGRHLVLAGFLILLIIADISLGVYTVYLLADTHPGDDALAGRVTECVKYFYIVTLIHNLICTILISLKIWRVQHEVDRYSPAISALRNGGSSKKGVRGSLCRRRGWMPGDKLILVIVESAAIYSLLLIIMIIMSVFASSAMLAMLNLVSPIIGIVFSMVIIRVSIDRTHWDSLKISTHLNFVMSSATQGRPRRSSSRWPGLGFGVQQEDGITPTEELKVPMGDLERGVGSVGLHVGMGPIDDSGFDEISMHPSITSEKLPLPSITFNANPSLTSHPRGLGAGFSSLDDLTASIGQVTVASYTAAEVCLTPMGSRRGSDAGLGGGGSGDGGLGVGGVGIGGTEVGSLFSVGAGGESIPGSFFCAI